MSRNTQCESELVVLTSKNSPFEAIYVISYDMAYFKNGSNKIQLLEIVIIWENCKMKNFIVRV